MLEQNKLLFIKAFIQETLNITWYLFLACFLIGQNECSIRLALEKQQTKYLIN